MENNLIPRTRSSLGFFRIIRESFKTTNRNGKVLFPILLLVFVSFSLLDFAQTYLLVPVIKDFALQLANHPNMIQDFNYTIDQATYVEAHNDIREFLLVKILFMATSSMITLSFLVAIISSSYEAHTAKVLDPKDLILILLKSWKRPLVTSFCMTLLTFGIIFLYSISIVLTTILAANSWAILLLIIGAITLSIPFCYFYMAALWNVSMVVSVLEEGFGGVKAIGRASELMSGKRLQASLMIVLFAIVYGVVQQIVNALTSINLSMNVQHAIRIPLTNGLICMWTLFMFVVYTVFYHERKTSHDEKEGKGFYLPIADGYEA